MEDPKKLTVKALRELAQKHLGTEEARGKTREELLKALKGAVKEGAATLKRSAKSAVASAKRAGASKTKAKASPAASAKAPAKAKAKPTSAAVHTPPASVPRKGAAKPAQVVKLAKNGKRAAPASAPAGSPEPVPAEPLVEGFFVARVAGEDEARRHHLVEDKAPTPTEGHGPHPYDEHLGELPDRYDDDAALLLPRDPHTLFFLWDFKDQTRAAAAAGLEGARAVLRVFEGAALVKELDFALESHSYYLHDLAPGRSYRVEAYFVGRDGRSQRVGMASNVIALPADGPSSNTEVRFLRVPWGLPLARLKEYLRDGRARLTGYDGPRPALQTRRDGGPSSASLAGVFSPGEHAWTPPRSGRKG